MKTKLLITGLLAAVIAFAPVFSGSVQAAEKDGKVAAKSAKKTANMSVDKVQKTRGGGSGEPVSNKVLLNDPKVTIPAPPSKGGGK